MYLVQETETIRVPEMLFHVFNKLKNEIQNFIVRFCFYLNMKNKIQILEFSCLKEFYFEFLIPSFVFHFHKKKENKLQFVFRF